MGKVKKQDTSNKDDGQKKILSFFQKSTETKPKPQLFSEHGKTSGNINKIGQCIVIDDDSDFKPSKLDKDKHATYREHGRHPRECLKSIAQQSVTCIPETQLTFTPLGKPNSHPDKSCNSNGKYKSRVQSDSSDFELIPDTPEHKDEKLRPKRPIGRSFLLSSKQIASNPIQKAKENRLAKQELKKKACQAKKGLTSLSVNFNEKSGEPKTSEISSSDISNCAGNMTGIKLGEKCSENEVIKSDTSNKSDVTPTKVYLETGSVKRMAKTGSSPSSKRSGEALAESCQEENDENDNRKTSAAVVKQLEFSASESIKETGVSDVNEVASKEQTSVSSANKTDIRKEQAKLRQLERKRREEMELKLVQKEERKRQSEKILKYQLTGTTEEVEKTGGPVSLVDDDALCDILQELGSPSVVQNKKTSPQSRNLFTKTKPVMRKSIGLGSKCNNGRPQHVTSKETYDAKSESLDVPDCNVSMNEWTAEDDEFFAQLGVDTGKSVNFGIGGNDCNLQASKQSVKLPVSNSDIVKLQNISVIKLKSRTKKRQSFETDSHNKSNSISKTSGKEVSLCGAVEDIEHFLTPNCQATERLRPQEVELEIEEFVTQQITNDEHAADIECMQSPLRTKRGNPAAGLAPIQREAPCSQYGRHTVTRVQHDRTKQETVLELTSQEDSVNRTCTLHGFWLDTQVEEGDTVNVLADFVDYHSDITDQAGLLIVNPDLLISGTTVVSSVFCMRKSILKEKFKGCDSRNVHMLYGSIIHSVFQQMLKKRLSTESAILEESQAIVKSTSNLLEIYANKSSEGKVLDEIKSYIPQMLSWIKQHTLFGNSSIAGDRGGNTEVHVTKVCDIEENIWSPRFGIKGKIDLTVEVKMKNEPRKALLPLELKTGKTSFSVEHKGQVSLYSMMYGDRRVDPKKGLLLYLKEPSMKIIPAEHVHQKGLIQMRNEMAHYISQQVKKVEDDNGVTFNLGRLPDPISNIRACQKCPQLINCAIYQRQVEGRSSDGSGMSGLVNDTLGHLTSNHMTYFIQWCLMLDLEKQVDQSKKTVADIWCKSSIEREDAGLCLSGMVLSDDQPVDLGSDAVVVTFHRQAAHCKSTPLSSVGICVQDSIVVSRETPAWVAVCTGFVQGISGNDIQILLERESVERMQTLKDEVWRLDKCDSFSTAGMLYTNVSKLMMDDAHSGKLRGLIIDKMKPEFINTLSKGSIEKVKTIFKTLNKPQKTAILKVLMSKDYVLIKGYPGTGKTSTIVALVKVLNILGLSVLLTSYTHSAVDNILLKLKKDDVGFLRVGRVSKIHADIKPYSVDSLTQGFTTTEQLENFFMSQRIVATSCLGMSHPLFSHRQFDVCIVDEATQVVQPACLGPLFMCRKFVLVGDPKQLPPVVQSKEARGLGMGESLYMRLDGLGATFDLNLQYRMNSEIMKISNILVYGGSLKCGSDDVANQTLVLTSPGAVKQITEDVPWMSAVLDDCLNKSVVFLDTKQIQASHSRVKGGGFKNDKEAGLVLQIVKSFLKVGVDGDDIGVIAPYRAQVLHLREKLGQGHPGSCVEVNTVDQYQGRDKNIIIISFVISSSKDKEQAGELLQDLRRLNVAVTRARLKLILLGNSSTLTQYSPLKQLLDMLQQQIVVLE